MRCGCCILAFKAKGRQRALKGLPAPGGRFYDANTLCQSLGVIGIVIDCGGGIAHRVFKGARSLCHAQKCLAGRVNAVGQHLGHLHGELLQLGTQRLPGNGIVAHVALKVPHVGIQVFKFSVKGLYLFLQRLALGAFALGIIQLHLRFFQPVQFLG